MALDENGWEIPDPTPVSVPSGFKRPETLAEQVQRLVRTSISRQAAEQGDETFEESEDFDLPDDPEDPSTPYEEYFDPVLGRGITAHEFRANFEVYRQRYIAAEQAAQKALDISAALRRRPGQLANPPAPTKTPADSIATGGAGASPAPGSKAT